MVICLNLVCGCLHLISSQGRIQGGGGGGGGGGGLGVATPPFVQIPFFFARSFRGIWGLQPPLLSKNLAFRTHADRTPPPWNRPKADSTPPPPPPPRSSYYSLTTPPCLKSCIRPCKLGVNVYTIALIQTVQWSMVYAYCTRSQQQLHMVELVAVATGGTVSLPLISTRPCVPRGLI